MPTPAFLFYQVKRIFLACPGDLTAERSRFPRLIETVNNLRAHSLGLHVEPVGWERVIPSFGRPQTLINQELELADLVVVMFWNRIGSPAFKDSARTGTLEEFDAARRLHAEVDRPLVWVYFKRPTTQEQDEQLRGVLDFRQGVEREKDLFFREYETTEEWAEMFMQHLVAFLDGLKRWDIDDNAEFMRPDRAVLRGEFLGQGIYQFGTTMKLKADLDGDGYQEHVCFEFRHYGFSLWVEKFGSTFTLDLSRLLPSDDRGVIEPAVYHLAVKDVTNDGLPEVLLAVYDGSLSLKLGVFGFAPSSRSGRDFSSYGLLAVLEGQRRADVWEGGTIVLPYGTGGHAFMCTWTGKEFSSEDLFARP
jgi:hypothetical protein